MKGSNGDRGLERLRNEETKGISVLFLKWYN
jgi:hypothetical protein